MIRLQMKNFANGHNNVWKTLKDISVTTNIRSFFFHFVNDVVWTLTNYLRYDRIVI